MKILIKCYIMITYNYVNSQVNAKINGGFVMIKSVKKFSKKSLAILIALLMIISVMPLTPPISVEAAEGYEVLGNVTLDPIIYTHGAYNGTTNSEYAYMMYGSTIADGSFDGECKTAVSVSETSTKTIFSVEAVDVSGASLKGARLKVENGLLKGSLGSDYEGSKNANKTVTLKFTFSDGTYEYHKMPVKTNPVAQHIAGNSTRYQSFGYKRCVSFISLAVGSYGQTNNGSYTVNNKRNDASATHNFKKMYAPFNTDTSAGYYGGDDKFPGAIEDAIVTEKQAGYAARNNTAGINKQPNLQITSAEAKYYLDLSSNYNYGIVKDGDSYCIDVFIGKIFNNFEDNQKNDNKINFDYKSVSGDLTEYSVNSYTDTKIEDDAVSQSTDVRGYIRYKINNPKSGNTAKGTSTISYKSNDSVYAQLTLNMPVSIQITDKSNTRKLYKDYIKDLAPRCYTAGTWATFRDELLKVEEYLNDNTDTSTIDTTDLEKAYKGLKPSEDANAHTYGNFTHKYKDGLEYNKDTTYNHTRSCSKCGNNDTQPCKFGDLEKDGNTATLTCSVCGGKYTLALEAYNNAVADAKNSVNNTVAYTSDSINALSSVLSEQAEKLIKAKTQDDVDSCTTTIISKNKLAKDGGVLVLEQYAITVKYFDATGNDLGVGEKGATSKTYPAVNYGSIQNIVAPTSYDGKKYSVYKWARDSHGNNTISGLNSSSLDVVVKGASTYYVFLKRTSVDDKKVDNNAVITLNNKSGNVADIGYVPMEQNETEIEATVTVDINNSTITIDNTTLTAPTYSFYTLEGFYINGTLYSKSGTVTITKNTVITPYYNASLFVDINRASGEKFTINNENTDSYKAKWNQRVTLKSSKEVMWLDENDVVLAQGTTYSFYANSNVTIKTKEVGSVGSVIPTASIGYFDYDSTLNKVTVVNNFFVPEGQTVEKAGVILSTKNSTVETLKAQSNGKFEGGTESFTSTGNQIRISVSRTANTPFTMYALAYVVVDGTTYYANKVKSINYTPKSA